MRAERLVDGLWYLVVVYWLVGVSNGDIGSWLAASLSVCLWFRADRVRDIQVMCS